MRLRPLLVPLLLAATAPGRADAQSLLSSGGLGLPVEPLDARARALGSVGVGLFGPALRPVDPAAAWALGLPSIGITAQPTWGSFDTPATAGDVQGTRFPLLGVAYPVGGVGMATLTFGGFLDQRWSVSREGVIHLAGQEVPFVDTFDSDGGVATLRLGWAQRIGETVLVGATVGAHMGQVSRRFTRTLDSLAVGASVDPFVETGSWRYGGPTASVGLTWDPIELLRVAGTASWSGTLEATPEEDTPGEGAEFALPTEFRLGASGALTPQLSLHLGLARADWSETGESLGVGTVTDVVWTYGGGLEWEGSSLLGRRLPLRFGYRTGDLPFTLGGEEAEESVWAGGFGINLVQVEDLPLARMDLALERGERSAGLLSEEFWRGTLSIRLSGN